VLREHKQAIANVRKFQSDFEELGRVAFETRPFATAGGTQEREIAILNEDQAIYLMTLFRNTLIVRQFKLALVKEFRRIINELHRIQRQQLSLDWQQQRMESRVEFRLMNATLQMVREHQGKETKPHHYANEARLINFALTGDFKPVDRNSATAEDLALLAKLELKNTLLMGLNQNYEDRKAALQQYAVDLRTPRQPALTRDDPQRTLGRGYELISAYRSPTTVQDQALTYRRKAPVEER
jgi:phage regulator Rha-like protein